MPADSPRRRRPTAAKPSKTTGRSPPPEQSHTRTRQVLAQRTAQLLAGGMDDYHTAKLKAAKQLGLSTRDQSVLPDNHEIDDALRQYLALFVSDTQPVALTELRKTAIRAMQWLDEFSPWLRGGVLTGTANETSTIELELIGVDAKIFELFLLNQPVEFDIREHHAGQRDRQTRDRSFKPRGEPTGYSYELTFDDIVVEISLYENHVERQAKFPRASIKHDRIQLAEAMNRFNAA